VPKLQRKIPAAVGVQPEADHVGEPLGNEQRLPWGR
jgi:hypothetical protein